MSRTRADVARAALEVLTTEGSDAVTHARVAEIAGYSKTTLYTHWPARIDLIAMAIESLGDMPHHERTGDLRADLIGELKVFRAGVLEMRLDRVLSGMAEWASVEQMARIRDKVNTDGQHQMYEMLGELFSGAGAGRGGLDAHRRGRVPVDHVRHRARRRGHRGGRRHRAQQRADRLTGRRA